MLSRQGLYFFGFLAYLAVLPIASTVASRYVRDGRVALVDPLPRLCDATPCRLVEGGGGNFREDSHVTQTASLDITADFRAAYERLGHRRQGQGS